MKLRDIRGESDLYAVFAPLILYSEYPRFAEILTEYGHHLVDEKTATALEIISVGMDLGADRTHSHQFYFHSGSSFWVFSGTSLQLLDEFPEILEHLERLRPDEPPDLG
jgi:hypothetical protein